MADRQLPTAGGSTVGLVLLAAFVLGIGIPLLVIVRHRGIGGAAAVVVALVVGVTALGSSPLAAEALGSTDWTLVSSSGGSLTYQSNAGFTLAAGAVSTTTFGVTWSSTLPASGSFTIATSLPTGIGGETNGANNTASITVLVSPP